MSSDEFTRALDMMCGVGLTPREAAPETFDALLQLIEENMKEMAKPRFQLRDSAHG